MPKRIPRAIGHQLRRRADKWLALITLVIVYGFVTLHSQQNQYNSTRVEATEQRCELTQSVIDTAVDLGVPADAEGLTNLRTLEGECLQTLAKIKEQQR